MDLRRDIFHLWYKSVSTTLSLLAYPKSGCYTTIQDSGSSCVGWGIGQLRSHVQNTTTLWLPSCPLPPRFVSEKGGQSNLPRWQDLSSISKPPFFDPKKGKKLQFHQLFSWAWTHKGMTTGLLIPPCLPLCKSASWGLMILVQTSKKRIFPGYFFHFKKKLLAWFSFFRLPTIGNPRKTSNIPQPQDDFATKKQGCQVSTVPFGKWKASSTPFSSEVHRKEWYSSLSMDENPPTQDAGGQWRFIGNERIQLGGF